jgi:hypothetical protein
MMANKKIWLGMLVMVLAFGMTVVGCAAMAAYEAASLARQAEAGGSTTARSAGGGRIDYTNTSRDTYLLWNSLNNQIWAVTPRSKGYLQVAQDREIVFRFRIRRDGEREADWKNENTSFWPSKSFYVSGGETFTLEIP